MRTLAFERPRDILLHYLNAVSTTISPLVTLASASSTNFFTLSGVFFS